ncbi:hypothetical protein BC939DRAFT_66498 [Gamsiella multidivaricata]|uniref:uncharacterized protein n=1 Tax=Gamsiella multidivaricata TaxID=101098 RepID=UPI00221F8588|nr:uncharacterized protein BC939DRAFT_66498 [Gamsiella multidivaricata]KAI7816036.1 hypothetical protein BC939DRAFT_66498 [Gamsiella multidivaricata]
MAIEEQTSQQLYNGPNPPPSFVFYILHSPSTAQAHSPSSHNPASTQPNLHTSFSNMCSTIACVAWDGLVIVGLILLIIWILSLVNVIHVGSTAGLKHIFIVLAVVFIIAWIFTRFCYGRRRGGGRRAIV